MSNKENMRQAMKELLGLVGIETKEEQRPDAEVAVQKQEVAETMEKSVHQVEDQSRFGGSFLRREERAPEVPEGFTPVGETADPFAIRVSGTVIAAGTSVFGDIRAEGDVDIQGKLKGNVEAMGNVRISGKVLGDVKGDSIELVACAVQGNITAASRLVIDQGSVIVGDRAAAELITDGKVKGNVQVSGAATFEKRSVLAGNVTAGLVSMTQGAKIQGIVRIDQGSETNALFGDDLDI